MGIAARPPEQHKGGIVQPKPNAVTTPPPKPSSAGAVGTNNSPSLTLRIKPSDPRGTVVPIPISGSHPRPQHPSRSGIGVGNAAIFHRQIKTREEKKEKKPSSYFFFSRWAAVEFSITYFPRSPSDLHPHRGCSRMGAAWGAAQLLPHTVRLWGQSWDKQSPPRPPLIFITEPHRRIARSPPTPQITPPPPPAARPGSKRHPLTCPHLGG